MGLKPAAPQFKVRCSALGKLMSEPKSKADKEAGNLSEIAKTMLTLWYKEQLYARRAYIGSKYLDKGISCEDEAIAYVNPLWTNNKEQFSNEYLCGEPDVITDDEIIDIKNSWDFTTFPLFSKTCPSKDYEWQVLGYMDLTGKRKAKVIYTLMDIPDSLIPFGADVEQFKYHTVDRKLRVKEFTVAYDEEKVAQIKIKVAKAQAFINALMF